MTHTWCELSTGALRRTDSSGGNTPFTRAVIDIYGRTLTSWPTYSPCGKSVTKVPEGLSLQEAMDWADIVLAMQ